MRQFDQKPSLDELMHHGVKGMKWGVRKQESKSTARVGESLDITTPKGSKVHLEESLPGPVRRSLAVVNPRYRKTLEQSRSFVISVDNKRVGRVSLREKSKDEVNFVWIGVNPKHRGKGYASTIFDAGVEYSKQKGYSRITLEVPGNAPDARHIYEKRGFKQSGPMQGNKNDLWGGLTPMSYDIPKDRALNHADGVTDSEMENALEQTFAPLGINETMFSDDLMHGELTHHGVKGMKWGVRKEYVPHPEASGSQKTDAPKSPNAKRWANATANHIKDQSNITKAEKVKNMTDAEKKFAAKSDPSLATGKGLTESQKKALKIAVGIGAAAVLAGAIYYNGKTPLAVYQATKNEAKLNTWGQGIHITEKSFERPELTLPAGHVFTRISKFPEKEWYPGTYTSHNLDDYNRYLGDAFGKHSDALGHPSELYKVTFKAKEPVKIPDLGTVLDNLKEVMQENYSSHPVASIRNTVVSDKEVIKEYQSYSGGNWNSDTATKLFDKLGKKGYHGIIDEMDAGTYADTPLVLFKHDALTSKTTKRISPQEIVAARKAISPLKEPKLPPSKMVGYEKKVATMRRPKSAKPRVNA